MRTQKTLALILALAQALAQNFKLATSCQISSESNFRTNRNGVNVVSIMQTQVEKNTILNFSPSLIPFDLCKV